MLRFLKKRKRENKKLAKDYVRYSNLDSVTKRG